MNKSEFLVNLENVENLPTLPAVVRQLQTLMASPLSSMAQIAAVITRDQAIAARTIRLINSAFYGMGGRVTSIQHAIVLLGLNTVKNLVTGVSVLKIFNQPPAASLFDREKFWLHTFACALGARAIGREINAPEPEDFFLAGLLHDIGILILDQFFHEEFIEILQRSACDGTGYIHAEKAVLGLTHEDVGEFVARKWKIPELLMLSIRYHHNPSEADNLCAGSVPILSAVHIADVTANNRGLDMGHPVGEKTCDAAAMRTVRMTERRIEELFDGIVKEVKAVAAEWGV
ncbi:MAG: HDOD domain-containing protein [Chitinispirillaceae bacterium]|nr:HDOD domain-containing protein [Chitinispirillaceae bacterium]